MPDKLFDIVLAELQKIPYITIKGTHRNSEPLTMYGNLLFHESGQIIVDFDKAVSKKWGIIQLEDGEPLADLECVRHELARDNRVWWPAYYNQYFLVYERPIFDGIRYERGRIELVAVGTLPFFGYSRGNGKLDEYLMNSQFFPDDLCDGGIDSQLIDHHAEIWSHLRDNIDPQ